MLLVSTLASRRHGDKLQICAIRLHKAGVIAPAEIILHLTRTELPLMIAPELLWK